MNAFQCLLTTCENCAGLEALLSRYALRKIAA